MKIRLNPSETHISSGYPPTGCGYFGQQCDYIYFWTSYASEGETLDLARESQLRASFRFSSEFYLSKLRQQLGLHLKERYKVHRSALLDSIAIKLLRYLSSVTLVCEKRNSYRQD